MAGTSYKDPSVLVLASNVEQRLGLPDGLLANIVTKGERSNSDQVSEAGARGLGQIIPATRKAAISKYGIDPYLSDENSLQVAGHLLKDSLDRNKGDVSAAVSEYHGGTNRDNWGPRTRSYVARVVGDQAEQPASAPGPAATQSTYARLKAQQQPAQPTGSAIAAVYDAYKGGRMTPEESRQFEGDVKGGLVMLPQGAALNGAPAKGAKPAPTMLPQGVTDAYVNGQMSDKEKTDLEADIKSGLVTLPATAQSKIPTGPDFVQPTTQGVLPKAPPTPGIVDQAIGAGEAVLNTGAGMTFGAAGMVQGAINGLARSVADGTFGTQEGVRAVEASAARDAARYSAAPRTEAGQDQSAWVGDKMQALLPVAAIAHTLPPMMSGAATGIVRDSAAAVTDRAAAELPQAVRDVTAKAGREVTPVQAGQPAPIAPAVEPMPPAELAGVARKAGGGSDAATKVLAEQASPGPAIVKSAQRLGIENDLQPDHVTTNESYRQVSAVMKSINPGSALSLAEREGLGRVAERANSLVDEIGGTRDLSALDSNIKTRLTGNVAELDKQAEALYARLRDEIPAKTQVPADNVLAFIAKRADDLGGTDALSPMEKRILSRLTPKDVKSKEVVPADPLQPGSVAGTKINVTQEHPTYTRLDDVRKDVGSALKMQGPFKDANTGLVKKLYSLLSEDQQKVADSAGMGDVFMAAKKAVQLRKEIENDLTSLFGKSLDRSFVGGGQVGLPGAITGLAKGDSSQLTRLLSAVPEDMRQSVVASGLGTVLRKASTRGEVMDFTGYAKWYEALRTNRKAYAAVMSNLPLTARKQLAALYNVSKGVSDSLNRRVKTGAVNSIKEELLGKDTLMQKLYGAVKDGAVGAAVGTGVGIVAGPGIGGAVASILTKAKPRSMAAVDELIVSPEFANLVRTTAGSKEQVAAVKKVASSPKFIEVIRAAKGKVPTLSEREQWILENMRPVPIQQQDRHQASPNVH